MPAFALRSRTKWFSILAISLVQVSSCLAEPHFRMLYSFTGMPDGGGAYAGVALDQKGDLYGTTSGGGAYGYGTVYKLKRQPGGQWTERILHSFTHGSPDGEEPAAGVIFDAAGHMYGTAQLGGINHAGTVFEMESGPAGWSFKVIYSFCSEPDCADGSGTWGDLTTDAAGNLYGTAFNVFRLSSGPDGWTETVLHDFCQQCRDGWQPFSGVALDAKGNLFGTTQDGGLYGDGTVFKLRRMPDGTWKERILHDFASFTGDGLWPGLGHLTFDAAGNLYGTTIAGGGSCQTTCGTVFKLTRQPNGHWKETILHAFRKASRGYRPVGGVTLDATGNLYGTTLAGGNQCDCGVIYKLSPNPDGTWTYTVLHNFSGSDGAQPESNLVLDDKGNLYGTAVTGGPGGAGVVFKLTP